MDGYESSLAFTGSHEKVRSNERMDSEFWDLVITAFSHGDLPDAYPFNPAGSAMLRDNAEPQEGRNA